MKRQIRRGVFETNSSSVHSISLCMLSEYQQWREGKLLFWEKAERFGTREEMVAELKKAVWSDGELRYSKVNWNDEDEVAKVLLKEYIYTYEQYYQENNNQYTVFEKQYTTEHGDEIVAIGYYGHD